MHAQLRLLSSLASLTALALLVAAPLAAQDLIHYWNFNSPTGTTGNQWPAVVDATSGAGQLAHEFEPGTLQAFAGSSINAQGGDPAGSSFSVQNGSSATNNGRSFTLHVPTSGYDSIQLAYATQRTATGFATHAVAYSLDGETFEPFATIGPPGSFGLRSVDFSSVEGAADNAAFAIRVTVDGGDPSFASGNNRFDNITITGTPLGEDPVFTTVLGPQLLPTGEAFSFTYAAHHPDGDPVTFSLLDGPAGASIDAATGEFSWTPAASDDGQRQTVTVGATAGVFQTTTSTTLIAADDEMGASTRDLYFSKYVWGGSFDKAVEIYNGTGGDVDLSAYTLEVYFNANTTPQSFTLSGILGHGASHVVAHSSAGPVIAAAADQQSGVVNFNGDDAVVLRSGNRIADVIGYVGEPRVTVWGSGQVTTGQNSLWRRPNACQGLNDAFDLDYNPADYFVSFPSGTFEHLGTHVDSCDEPSPNQPPAFVTSLSTKFVDGGTLIERTFVAQDPDGDPLTYTLTRGPDDATFDPETGAFSWTATGPGVAAVTVTASDGWDEVSSTAVIGVRGEVCPELFGAALRECIRDAFTPERVLGYDTAARDTMYGVIDLDEGFVRGIYTGFEVAVDDPANARPIMNAGGINAEHVWPQSRGAGAEPARSDLHNLFPSHAGANSSRSNHPFMYVAPEGADAWWGTTGRIDPAPTENFEVYSRRGGSLFEPRDFAKGPVARSILYFFAIYEDVAEAAFMLTQKDVLTEWTSTREAELWELERTWKVSRHQRNVNPFVVDGGLAARMLTDIEPPQLTVAEARAEPEGALVMTEGVVTRAAGRYTRFQDGTGGLTIFETFGPFASAVAAGDVAPGDHIRVIGTMSSFNALIQLDVSTFEVLSRGNPLPEPVPVTLAQIAADGASYESQLISVAPFFFQEGASATLDANTTFQIADAHTPFGTVALRIQQPGDGDVAGSVRPADAARFTGVLGRFLSTFQLMPVGVEDVEPWLSVTDVAHVVNDDDLVGLAERDGIIVAVTNREAPVLLFLDANGEVASEYVLPAFQQAWANQGWTYQVRALSPDGHYAVGDARRVTAGGGGRQISVVWAITSSGPVEPFLVGKAEHVDQEVQGMAAGMRTVAGIVPIGDGGYVLHGEGLEGEPSLGYGNFRFGVLHHDLQPAELSDKPSSQGWSYSTTALSGDALRLAGNAVNTSGERVGLAWSVNLNDGTPHPGAPEQLSMAEVIGVGMASDGSYVFAGSDQDGQPTVVLESGASSVLSPMPYAENGWSYVVNGISEDGQRVVGAASSDFSFGVAWHITIEDGEPGAGPAAPLAELLQDDAGHLLGVASGLTAVRGVATTSAGYLAFGSGVEEAAAPPAVTAGGGDELGLPDAAEVFSLAPPYPNPSRSLSILELTVDVEQHVRVEVFNVLGQRVLLLHEGMLAPARLHQLQVDVSSLPSGAYIVRAQGETTVLQQRMLVVK